ncbi:uncharacterized protein LOC117239422 isoform X9 [Bombus vosnesenskii]|uniref:Uncharacterized protein LOC117239422 isoform X9 n=1 Tax=Bombus vosnesenskii TaxID=207650 RepID=A0A6J3L5E6_9HYME|nr:uncharacterized protein LOC117239422 isoform X9 [Bombus vosnesenskii]
MEAAEEIVDENPWNTDARTDRDSTHQTDKSEDQGEQEKVLSIDKVTVEKIVLESAGSREVLLTKNETSLKRKLSIKSEPGKSAFSRSKTNESADSRKFRVSLPGDILAPNSTDICNDAPSKENTESTTTEKRIKPVKLSKSPSIGSIAISLKNLTPTKISRKDWRKDELVADRSENKRKNEPSGKIKEKEERDKDTKEDKDNEIEEIDAKNRLEKSQTNIEVLQQNLNTKIDANTAQKYKKKLLESRENRALKLSDAEPGQEKLASRITFDEEFLQKHNLDKRLKIEEYGLLDVNRESVSTVEEESDSRKRPIYSEKVLEVEKRWSGEFLKNQLDRHSSESSKSSYVEELGSVSSRESEDYDPQTPLFDQRKRRPEFERSIDLPGNRTCEEILADSTLSTVDSDSCLEDRIKSLDEDIREKENERIENDSDNVEVDRRKEIELGASNLWNESVYLLSKEFWNPRNETAKSFTEQPRIESEKISSSTNTDSVDFALVRESCKTDGYANLIREFTMEAGTSSRTKKEEKQKKKLGLRRLLPGFFSPKDSRKDYKKKESKERKRPDDRHFARYQQNGNYTRSPDTMNLNEDIKRNVKLDNSLNGSIIEERLDEIKRELFPDQGPITSTPDHLARDEDHEGLLRDRSGAPRSYTTDSSLSSIAPDERWNERNAQLGISPDIRKFEQRQKREEFSQRCGQRYGQLERKHSLQEPNHASRPPYFFQRNHAPSGRISAPPSERYLVRPRAIHPMDRPLPAIPHSRTELANYENYLEEQEERQEQIARYGKNAYDKPPEYLNEPGLYENDNPPGLILKSVSAQVKITRQPIVNQNHRAPLVGRSPKYLSSGSSQKSGDYGDSSCTPNSSQKSEFSPSSSKSGEYYLHSPRNSGSPNGREFDEEDSRQEGIYENEKSPSRSSTRCMDERIYDETPASPSPCQENLANAKQLDRSIEDSLDKRVSPSQRTRSRGERPVSPRENLANEKREDERQAGEANNREESNRGPTSPSGSQGKPISPFGSRQRLPASRRAQPNEQILIASPKRETTCETRIPRPSNDSRRCAIESPVHMTNTPRKLVNVNSVDQRNQDSSPNKDATMTKGTAAANGDFNTEIPRPEPIYGYKSQRNAVVSSPRIHSPENINHRSDNVNRNDGDDRVAWVQAHTSSPQASPQQPSEARTSPLKEVQPNTQKSVHLTESGSKENHHHREQTHHSQNAVASRQVEIQLARNANRVGVEEQSVSQQQESRPETMYVQKICEPMYGQRGTSSINSGPLSPSKQKTRQHLEAFYWQQKALEAHRKSLASPVSASSRQMARKIDLPEVREAVYWQQLKKLDEEQQRRIYEQNLMEESSYCKKNPVRTSTPRQTAIRSPTSVAMPVAHGNPASWSAGNLRCSKSNPIGKPPLMQSQKGQNQPVLIVRPQQAIRDRRDLVPSTPLDPARQEAQRSKSASPHFHRGEGQVVPRKLEVSSIYEQEANDVDGKTVAPPPIFKRGSLIGGECVEYGTAGGAKRVSFSNQSAVGQDLASGSWPTKHGTAPEPPTRRHRSEDSVSDSDSVFLHQERRDVNCLDGTEYDADRPLPPLPKDVASGARSVSIAGPGPARSVAYNEVRWNNGNDPRRAVSPQRVLQQKEEEWNSDGKGRQSNDIGGSGRGEGEAGSNEVATGRRGGSGGGVGSGVGGGGGGGGSVLGVGGGGSVGGGSGSRSGSGGGGRSRDEPRRHTLGGDHQPSLHHQQFNAAQQLHPLHPHHLPPPHGQYGTPPTRHTTMDLESPLPRGYPPPSSTMLFDDDPGIMSEVETSSTGFRRGGKQRSSLPVVRTPSKTLERPLGLVFLQYRNETKRALLPNEITSIDTVKALFVRSFPKQLTMEYLDSPHVKVYIHDSNKDMFYELEDLRSHLRDIRDRSVLRLFESTDGVTGMPGPLGIPGTGTGLPPHWEDQSYFSEPEFDSEYQHQHIHKSKVLSTLHSRCISLELNHDLLANTAKNSTSGNSGYYVGGSSTLPRGGQLMRAYSPAASSVVGGPNATPTQPKPLATPDGWIGGGGVPPAKPLRSYQCGKSPLGSLGGSARFSRDSSVSLYSIADRLHGESGYMSSPERGGGVGSGTGRYPPGPYSAGSSYEDPYYSQYSGTVTPVIDEEASGWCSDTELLEESYSLYGVKPPGRPPSGPPRSPFPPGAPPPLPSGGQSYDATRIRVEHMERQLANLTGLVQKALTHAPHTSPSPRDYLQVPAGRDPYARGPGAGDEFDKHSSSSSASLPVSQPAVTDDSYLRTDVKPPKLGKDKSVSFEKSVSFSDEPPDMNSPKQHSPQHAADTKPTKPAIKSSTLPRMSSQERDRHKPTPPPKPAALVAGQYVYRDMALTPEMYNQLRGLQKKAKDLRQEVRNLRRMSQAQAHTIRETILDTFITIRTMLLSCGDAAWDAEKIRLSREEDLYRQEMLRLVKDLTELENTVEELRGNVINRKTRVNMSDVENMALIMSKSSKTVADLKVRFPSLQEGMKGLLSSEMEMVVRAEKFLKEEPERLESALKRCKKLTSTLVTLKRLASVQEQRLPNAAASVDAEETPPITPTSAQHSKAAAPVPAERTVVGSASVIGGGPHPHEPPATHQQRPENALDALLDELQTFSRPSSQLGHAQGSSTMLSELGRSGSRGEAVGASTVVTTGRPPCISDIGRKGSVDSSSGTLLPSGGTLAPTAGPPNAGGTLRRLHSYPSSSDTDTSPPIARLQVSLQEQPSLPTLPQGFVPGQKPPVPERNAELLQLASARRVPPPPPPRTSSRSPLASPTSPQLPPRNHSYNLQSANATLRRPPARGTLPVKEGKPPMALPTEQPVATLESTAPSPVLHNNSTSSQSSAVLSTSNSSSCESVNSQEGLQSKKGRQEQLEQRHQELLRKQKALQEQYARLQQLQRNTAGLTTIPPAPPDLLKKTGSESNLLAKMGLGLSTASSGSLTSLTAAKQPSVTQEVVSVDGVHARQEESNDQQRMANCNVASNVIATTSSGESNGSQTAIVACNTSAASVSAVASTTCSTASTTATTTTSKIYETDIL